MIEEMGILVVGLAIYYPTHLCTPVWPLDIILVSIMGEITGCLWKNQVRSKLLKPLDKTAFVEFASLGIFDKWSRITSLTCPNFFATLSYGRISSNLGEN